MRTINELLPLLKKFIINTNDVLLNKLYGGFYPIIQKMETENVITYDEQLILIGYINLKKPMDFNKHTPFYWKPCDWKTRLDWLDKQIIK